MTSHCPPSGKTGTTRRPSIPPSGWASTRNAGDLNLLALGREIAEAAATSLTAVPHAEAAAGDAFTLTDSGNLGALFATPPLSPPQAGALALGAVVERPAAVRHEGGGYSIAIRSMAHLVLSYDQLVVSSAYAAMYLATMKARLEAANFTADLR